MKQTTGHHANEGALKHLLGFFHFLIKGSPAMMPIHTHVSSIAFAQPGATGFSSIKQRKREGNSLAWLRRQNRASWGGGATLGPNGARIAQQHDGLPTIHLGVPTPNHRRAWWSGHGVLRLYHHGTQKTISVCPLGPKHTPRKLLSTLGIADPFGTGCFCALSGRGPPPSGPRPALGPDP